VADGSETVANINKVSTAREQQFLILPEPIVGGVLADGTPEAKLLEPAGFRVAPACPLSVNHELSDKGLPISQWWPKGSTMRPIRQP
jgi:hypothetical protein